VKSISDTFETIHAIISALKDESDVVGLMGLMDDEERIKACELARRVGRARKLSRLLTREPEEAEETPDEFIA